MSQIIDSLNWRYATKKYDSNKKIDKKQIEDLIESIRLSPTSFGIQAYKVIHVKDKKTREKLQGASWGQSQVTEASELFVFAVPTDFSEANVDEFINLTAKIRNVSVDSLKDYSELIKGSLKSRSVEEKINWLTKQAYIALGILLLNAAQQKIDATPMEGFDSNQYNEILKLKDLGLTAVVAVTLGYRSADDKYADLTKVRVSTGDLVIEK